MSLVALDCARTCNIPVRRPGVFSGYGKPPPPELRANTTRQKPIRIGQLCFLDMFEALWHPPVLWTDMCPRRDKTSKSRGDLIRRPMSQQVTARLAATSFI